VKEVVKTLDTFLRTVHTLATLVRHSHWGVARGSGSFLGQGLAPLALFVIALDTRQAFFYIEISSPVHTPFYLPDAHLYLLRPDPDSSLSQGLFMFERMQDAGMIFAYVPGRLYKSDDKTQEGVAKVLIPS
jgi:hypothetical protein